MMWTKYVFDLTEPDHTSISRPHKYEHEYTDDLVFADCAIFDDPATSWTYLIKSDDLIIAMQTKPYAGAVSVLAYRKERDE